MSASLRRSRTSDRRSTRRLPPGFAAQEADAAAQHVLDAIRASVS
jgi:hypothetical protein